MRKATVIVRATEHLKEVAIQTIEAFKEGTISSAAEAAAKLCAEIQGTMQDLNADAFNAVLQLRIAVNHGEKADALTKLIGAFHEVGCKPISFRYLGPRSPDEPGVIYSTCYVPAIPDIAHLLDNMPGEVRDWSFGTARRGAA